MNEWILISIFLIAILVIIGIAIILVYWKKKKEGKIDRDIDYKVFYSLGFVWMPIGIVFMIAVNPAIGIAFMALGFSYIAIGLANRDKWKNKEK
jgi:tryptophan-rich sensory protein